MALFNLGSAGDISLLNDFDKVKAYLYKQNEQLRYMFNNLTPEDNYSDQARLTYVENEEKTASLEISVDGIIANVQNTNLNYKSSMELLGNLLSLNVESPDGASSVVLTGDKISLTTGKFIVNSKNLTIDAAGNATFSGALSAATGSFKGALEAATGTFAGDLQAAGGTFAGTLSAAEIVSPHITGEAVIECGDHFETRDLGSNLEYWIMMGTFQFCYDNQMHKHVMSGIGGLVLTDDGIFHGNEIYLDGWWNGWSLTRTVQALWDCVEDNVADPSDYDPD